MNEKIIALILALLSACVPGIPAGENPVNEPKTETAATETNYITNHYIINTVEWQIVESTGYKYYTVYAINLDNGDLECIEDDLSDEYLIESSEYWRITTGQKVNLVYPANMPKYTGILYPVETESLETCIISKIVKIDDYYEYYAYSNTLKTEFCIGSDMLENEYQIGDIIKYDHTLNIATKAG